MEIFSPTVELIIEIAGLLLGLAYLYYEYKASKLVWLFATLMPCISLFVYFSKGIYADFAINIYYLAISIYGIIYWSKGKSHGEERPVTYATAKTVALCCLCGVALWMLIYFVLDRLTNSNVPIPDAFTTAISMVGSWMLARKYVQQWAFWIAVDAVSVGLFIYKGIYPYAVLYLLYTVIAFFGYRKWSRLASRR